MHDFSQRRELTLHAEVAAAVTTALGSIEVPGIVIGAFARDLHLHYGAGVPIQRATQDIDFAFAVRSWDQFHALRQRLLESGSFGNIEGRQHRLRHRNKLTVDLVPFGGIETDERRIAWPPSGDVVMDMFGFQESVASAETALLPANVEISMVALPALALLKLVAWKDRHRQAPGKDAADLSLIMRNYLAVSANARRLWSEFVDWTESADFDYERGGARMVGHEMRRLVDGKGLKKVGDIVRTQIESGELPQEMDRRSPERAREMLEAVAKGFELGCGVKRVQLKRRPTSPVPSKPTSPISNARPPAEGMTPPRQGVYQYWSGSRFSQPMQGRIVAFATMQTGPLLGAGSTRRRFSSE